MNAGFDLLDGAGLWLAAALVRASLDGVVIAVPVWLACRLLPVLPAAARAWLWWAVSLKLLLAVAGGPSLPVPVLPAAWAAPAARDGRLEVAARVAIMPPAATSTTAAAGTGLAQPAGVQTRAIQTGSAARALAGASTTAGDSRTPAAPSTGRTAWWRAVTVAWALAMVGHLALLARDSVRLRRLLRRAHRVDPALENELEDIAKDLGLSRCPRVRESADVAVPQVVGLWRPAILLPASTQQRFSPDERSMMLCHEAAHVARRDLALGWIPAIAERLLVFHPIAWLAAREYALAREAACDSLVLRTLDTVPRDYGRLLVRLGVSAPAVRVAAAGSSPTTRHLLRRLHMLQHTSIWSPRGARLSAIAAAVVACLLPLRLSVAAADEMPATLGASVVALAAPVERAAVRGAATPQLAGPPRVEVQQTATTRTARGRDDGESWFYLDADGSTHGSGDSRDLELATRARGPRPGPAFFFIRDGRVHLVEDAETLGQVRTILQPQSELGRQQGELGAEQSMIGEQQARLGAEQGALGAQQAALGAEQAALAAQLAKANADVLSAIAGRMRQDSGQDASRRQEVDAKSRLTDLDRQMQELGAKQGALGEQQGQLGARQRELGDKQAELGDRQGRLGDRQRIEAERATAAIRALMERAMSNGTAREIK